jgi:hypothetical protein
MSRIQTTGQNCYVKAASKSFENVAKFKYLATTLTNQNFTREEINNGLNSGNALCHALRNLLSFRLMSKNVVDL